MEFNPNLDLGIVAAQALIQQRIMVRLQMARGWIYDRSGTLGSRLNVALAEPISEGIESIPSLIVEALDPMADVIEIEDIQLQGDGATSLRALITYHLLNTQSFQSQQTVVFPLI